MPAAEFAVAVDIGGTFTDITLLDTATGRQWRAKTPSTPSDPSEAFLAGVMLALRQAGGQPHEIGRVLHGTTVATNLILEGRTARTALVTTAGFRHVLKAEGVLTFEFPHLLNLIEQVQFDTIYHEHFSYLSLLAVEQVLRANGLRAFDVELLATHGGSLRLFCCHIGAGLAETEALLALR